MTGLIYYQVGWTIEDCETGLSEALAENLKPVSYTHLCLQNR